MSFCRSKLGVRKKFIFAVNKQVVLNDAGLINLKRL